jgi:hypothetical protein
MNLAIDSVLGTQLFYFLSKNSLRSHWQNMDLNSFADAFADSVDLQMHSARDAEDVKPELTRDEFFYFNTLVFQVIFVIRISLISTHWDC